MKKKCDFPFKQLEASIFTLIVVILVNVQTEHNSIYKYKIFKKACHLSALNLKGLLAILTESTEAI